MDTEEDEYGAHHWAVVLLEHGDGPINPHVLTQAEMREFIWWILDPVHYEEFRDIMRFRNSMLRRL